LIDYSIIIAAPDYNPQLPVLASLRACALPSNRHEIILALGRQPSRQRNRAIARASGKWLVFLDSDCTVPPDYFDRLDALRRQTEADVLGGPVLLAADAPLLQQIFQATLSHPLVTTSSAARYAPIGAARESNDSELILCNLAVRSDVFGQNGLFNESLYPNEENEWLERVAPRAKVWHVPDLHVHRLQRATWEEFFATLLRYGSGRARQTRLTRKLNAKLLPAAALILWLAGLLIHHTTFSLLSFFAATLYIALIAYTAQPVVDLSKTDRVRVGLAALGTLFFYALGQWLGLAGWPVPDPDSGEVQLVDADGNPFSAPAS
jgi:succinoglycan biosynthesis protein ExoA